MDSSAISLEYQYIPQAMLTVTPIGDAISMDYRLLADETIESTNLKFCLLNAKDKQDYIKLYTDPHITRFTGGEKSYVAALKQFELALLHNKKQPAQYLTWSVRCKQSMQFKGIAVLNFLSRPAQHTEIGVMLLKAHQDRGTGSECLRCLMAHAFDYYKQQAMLSFTEQGNIRAETVLKHHHFVEFKDDSLNKHAANGTYWRFSACGDSGS